MGRRSADALGEPLLRPNSETTAEPSAAQEAPPRTDGHGAWSTCGFGWVTPLMRTGSARQLQADDLLQLDLSLHPQRCGRLLWLNWTKEVLARPQRPSLLRALARTYGRPYAWLGLIKLLNDALSFSGPLLLRLLVAWLTTPAPSSRTPALPAAEAGAAADAVLASGVPGPHDPRDGADGESSGGGSGGPEWWAALAAALGPSGPYFGVVCVAALGATAAARALLNAHFNYQLSRLSCQLRAGLMTVLYRKALLAVQCDAADAGPATAAEAAAAAATGPQAPATAPANGGSQVHAAAPADEEQGGAGVAFASAGGVASAANGNGHASTRCGGLGNTAGNEAASGDAGAAGSNGGTKQNARAGSSGDTGEDGGSGGSGSGGGGGGSSGGGEDVVTLMSVDTGRAVNLLLSFHELWSLPVQMGVALYLLYTQVRAAFLAGLAVALLLLPVNRVIAARIGAASTRMMAAKDARVGAMSELLRGIRAVLVAPHWADYFVARVAAARACELRGLAVRKYLDALCVYFWAATQLLFSALTFGLLVLAAGPAALSPPVAFASLALFGLLTGPLNAFPWVVNGVVEALVSVRRLQRYLLRPETKALWAYDDLELTLRDLQDLPPAAADAVLSAAAAAAAGAAGATSVGGGGDAGGGGSGSHAACSGLLAALHEAAAAAEGSASLHDRSSAAGAAFGTGHGREAKPGPAGGCGARLPLPPALRPTDASSPLTRFDGMNEASGGFVPAACFVNATFAWGPAARPCLQGISLCIPRGALTVLVGRVGSGKSSLLAALLGGGELPRRRGGTCRTVGVRQLSYAPQRPWVTGGSVRDNVLLGARMDSALYEQVLHACALQPDLAAMPAGDLTPLGEHGCNLSGGQRARLGLARALYHAAAASRTASTTAGTRTSDLTSHLWLNGSTAHPAPGDLTPNPGNAPASGGFGADALLEDPESEGIGSGWDRGSDPDPGVLVLLDDVLASLDRACAAHVVTHGLLGPLLRPEASTPPPTPQQQEQPSPPAVSASPAAAPALAGSTQRIPPGPGASPPVPQPAHLPTAEGTCSLARPPVRPGNAAPHAPTVVLASNDLRCIAAAALVVVLEGGRVSYAGPPAEYLAGPHCLHTRQHRHQHQQQLLLRGQHGQEDPEPQQAQHGDHEQKQEEERSYIELGEKQGPDAEESRNAGGSSLELPAASDGDGREPALARTASDAAHALQAQAGVEAEERAVGHVRWRVYGRYVSAMGRWVAVGVLLSLALMQASRNASDLWVSLFAAHSGGGNGGGGSGGSAAAGFAGGAPTLPRSLKMGGGGSGNATAAVYGGGSVEVLPPAWHWCLGAGSFGAGSGAYSSRTSSAPAWPPAAVAVCPVAAGNPWAVGEPPAWLDPVRDALGSPAVLGGGSDGGDGCADGGGSGIWSARLFLTGVLVIAGANGVFTLARAFSFAFAGMRAARLLHERLLTAVLAAPPAFFDTVPHGRILNRFSSDVSTVDDSLPFILNIALANAVSLLGLLAVLCYAAPPLLPVLLPLGFLYRRLQLFYRSSSREIRRLEALALSPVYGAFGGLAEAAPCVRAFAAQPAFLAAAVRAVAAHQRAAITGGAASAWLALRLQLLAAALVAAVAGLAVWRAGGGATAAGAAAGGHGGSTSSAGAGTSNYSDNSSSNSGNSSSGIDWVASLAGLSLAYALPVVGLLNGLLTSTAETEQEMVAVERLCQYTDMQPQQQTLNSQPVPTVATEARATAAMPVTVTPAAQRPAAPRFASPPVVCFEGAVLRYRTGAQQQRQQQGAPPPALRGFSLVVAPGEHVVLVGRSGAGKSSVLAALLRLAELEAGRVLLYGVDVRAVPLRRLRSSVGVLLQSPFVAAASVRDNLDPAGAASRAVPAAAAMPLLARRGRAKRAACGTAREDEEEKEEEEDVAPVSDDVMCEALRRVGLWDALVSAAAHRRSSRNHASSPLPSSAPAFTADGDVAAAVLALPLAGSGGGSAAAEGGGGGGEYGGGGAVGLSAGQAQLLCLARLLLRRPRPRLVMLDECSAHCDPATAATIRRIVADELLCRRQPPPPPPAAVAEPNTLEAVTTASIANDERDAGAEQGIKEEQTDVYQPCAVLEVAHDLGAVAGCDRVVVMEGGVAVEEGPPGELMRREGGRYRALHAAGASVALNGV